MRFFIKRLPFGGDILNALDVSRATPEQIAAGAALGLFVALAPPNCGLTFLILFIAACTTANFAASVITGAALKPLGVFFLDYFAWEVGRTINEGGMAATIGKLLSIPGISLLGLERYHVMGAFVLSLAAAIPVFFVVRGIASVLQRGTRAAIEAAREKLRKGEKLTDEEQQLTEQTAPRKVPMRLKLVLLLAIIFVVLDLVALKPTVSWLLQAKLPLAVSAALGTPPTKVEWKDLDASIVKGVIAFDDFRIADPRNPDQDLLRARKAVARVSPLEVLGRRVVIEELTLEEPRMHVRRDQSGKLTIDPTSGTTATGPDGQPAATAGAGWNETVRLLLETAKKRAELEARERARREAERKGEKAPDAQPDAGSLPKVPDAEAAHATRRPETTAPQRLKGGIPGYNPDLTATPRVVVRKVSGANLEVEASDPRGAQPGFRFESMALEELSDDRVAWGRASKVKLEGTIVDAAKKAIGKLDVDLALDAPKGPGAESSYTLSLAVAELDLAAADAWLSGFCPLVFEKGTCKVTLDAKGTGLAGPLEAGPRIELAGVVAKPRDPSKPILGLDAQKVATEVTEAGGFALTDIKVTGTLLDPRVDMGSSLKQLVIEGGKRYVAKAAGQVADKAASEAAKKVEEKLGDKAGEATKGLLDKGKGLFGK